MKTQIIAGSFYEIGLQRSRELGDLPMPDVTSRQVEALYPPLLEMFEGKATGGGFDRDCFTVYFSPEDRDCFADVRILRLCPQSQRTARLWWVGITTGFNMYTSEASLLKLAKNPNQTVRWAVAMNEGYPR